MSDIKLDEDNDIFVENNDIVLITGTEEIRQRLLQNLKSFQGDWFLNLQNGVPYFQEIFRKDYDVEIISTVLKNTILNTLGVLELLNFDIEIDDVLRTLKLDFDVNTYRGELSISETII